jgi:hypothetical protein
MRHMQILELERVMEREIQEVVQKHYPLDWKEDLITHDLVIRFRTYFREMTLYGTRYRLKIQWEIYKMHGRRETSYGDIGLLVRYKMPSGTTIEGAGFLEAKVRGRDTTKFLQVRHEQVTRILSRSPQTQLLLYDYNPVTVLDSDDYLDLDWPVFERPFFHKHFAHARVTHGAVLPLQLAAAVNQYDDSLYRLCHSLPDQFSRRYFNLHDLDFSDRAVQAVKGFPSDLGSPNIVMVIRAAPQGQELPDEFHPNDNLYGAIKPE